MVQPARQLDLSVLLRLDLPPARAAELSFVTALTVADAVDALLPKQTKATLKWPNDVLVDEGKIAGILVENVDGAQIIGIGLNVLEAPRNAPYKTATLVGSGGIATVDGARDILLDSLAKHLEAWTEHGFAPIRTAWLSRAHPIGTKLRASISGRTEEGLFAWTRTARCCWTPRRGGNASSRARSAAPALEGTGPGPVEPMQTAFMRLISWRTSQCPFPAESYLAAPPLCRRFRSSGHALRPGRSSSLAC